MNVDEFEKQSAAAMSSLTPEKLDRMLTYMQARHAFSKAPPKVGLFGSLRRAVVGVFDEADGHAASVTGIAVEEGRLLTGVLSTHFNGIYAGRNDASVLEQYRSMTSRRYGDDVLALLTAHEAKFLPFIEVQIREQTAALMGR